MKTKTVTSIRRVPRKKIDFVLGGRPGDMSPPTTLPSMTVPDDTYSVRQIMARFASGIMPSGKEGHFDGEDIFIPNLDQLDLVELQELRDEAMANIREAEELHRAASKKQAELDDKKRFDEAVETRLKEMSFKKDGSFTKVDTPSTE